MIQECRDTRAIPDIQLYSGRKADRADVVQQTLIGSSVGTQDENCCLNGFARRNSCALTIAFGTSPVSGLSHLSRNLLRAVVVQAVTTIFVPPAGGTKASTDEGMVLPSAFIPT